MKKKFKFFWYLENKKRFEVRGFSVIEVILLILMLYVCWN